MDHNNFVPFTSYIGNEGESYTDVNFPDGKVVRLEIHLLPFLFCAAFVATYLSNALI